ncbi:hypothetical protein T4B_5913 [Trichinella pseudospiralis]|uniref:Uncharacterized protein n=1 Tax=Trichinella pseudospiralis TaxID=6337 RepID=A0A0V1ENJ7_TRIPS|nr:hypothetical protein T4A_2823 [Trichinella pseudospiralis]KRZ23335.1 hypothetical protein T4B_5913 [Trichinella pseudospiralis]KRZ38541.1 hypothetical protein T4C_10671 [Trichinella pseudospiralis]
MVEYPMFFSADFVCLPDTALILLSLIQHIHIGRYRSTYSNQHINQQWNNNKRTSSTADCNKIFFLEQIIINEKSLT